MKDFGAKTVAGLSFSVLSQIGRQAAVFLSHLALARLLTPADFGLIALALVFCNFTVILSEQGFSFALIQRDEVSEEQLSSVFWLNILVGVALSGAFALCAPLAARLYHLPDLAPVMRVTALMFLVFPLGMIHKVVLTRDLEFRSIAIVEVAAAWFGGAVAVALAWLGAGVFSVAIQFVVSTLIASAALWRLCPWRPRLIFRWSPIAVLTSYSNNMLMGSILNYWVRNIDNILIGMYLGPVALGLYSRAYAVMLFPISRVTWVFSRVMVRSFAIIRDDPARVRELFLRMTRVVALITVPLMLGIAARPEGFIAVVFGPQWAAMAPILRVLAVVGMVQSLSALVGSLYLSHDRMALSFRVALVTQAMEVAGIVMGLKWGALGVAVGYAAMSLLARPIACHYGVRLIGLTLGQFVLSVKEIVLCAGAMALVVLAVARLTAGFSPAEAFGFEAAAGIAAYWALLHGLRVRGYSELVSASSRILTAISPQARASS